MIRLPETAVACYHCGEDCTNELIHFEDHSFCCQGCKTVYQLLNESGLANFYTIEDGRKVTTPKPTDDRDYLDLPEVQQQMLDFREGSSARITFAIPSMHCSACIWLLERLYKVNPAVKRSEVNFLRREASVLFDIEQISLKELVILLEKIGYAPDLHQQTGRKERKKDHSLKVKIGVAGFAFGNVMLFSFPDYLSLDDASLEQFRALFGYLSLLLALPVLLYSGREYLLRAWRSIQTRHLTIDVPIALGIITLFAKSTYSVLQGEGPGYFDSFTGLVFFLLIGRWYQLHTYAALAFDRDFKSYFPIAVKRLRDGKEETCMLEAIGVGDRLRIKNNQVIPADAVLRSAKASIDYSFVSGESDLVQKSSGDILYAGGRQCSGTIEVEVVKEVSQGYLTSLWNQQSKPENREGFSSMIDRVSQWFSVGVLTIAALTLFYWSFFDFVAALDAFTAVLIIACPCALALAMPFASGNVMRVLSKRGLFVKNAETIERMAEVDTFVFDKTGTLTETKNTKLSYRGQPLKREQQNLVYSATSSSAHPFSQAIAQYLAGTLIPLSHYLEVTGAGIEATAQGITVRIGSAQFCELPKRLSNSSETHLIINGNHAGTYSMEKQLRSGMEATINQLSDKGNLHLLSGDNKSEYNRMHQLFGEGAALQFQQSPQDKRDYIRTLEERGNHCLMMGDGLNDAGALDAASVGIAVADDVFSFSPACDGIMHAPQLHQLPEMLNYARWSMKAVRISLVVSLLYNVVGLSIAVQGLLTPLFAAILMPLSSVTVVALVTLLTRWKQPQ